MSAFLAEVGETEGRRGLILPLLTQGNHDQHHQGDGVGQHLVQLLNGHLATGGGQIDVQDVQAAEEDGGQDADIGTPDGEDDQRNGQPAAVTEGVIGPDAVGVVHNIVQAAQSCDHGADAGGQVLILGDIDAGGVGSGSALTHGAQVQAGILFFLNLNFS